MFIFAIVPVSNGAPDIDSREWCIGDSWGTETARYCKFPAGTTVRPSWQIITEDEYETARPTLAATTPEPTLEDKVAALQEDNLILMDALATTYETTLQLLEAVAYLQAAVEALTPGGV